MMTYYQDGHTAFHTAAYSGEIDVMKLLLEKGADISSKSDDDVSQNTSTYCVLKKGCFLLNCIVYCMVSHFNCSMTI